MAAVRKPHGPPKPDVLGGRSDGLEEVVFLPIADNLVNINLYRSGQADTLVIPPAYKPALRNMRDHGEMLQLDVHYIQFNTRQPPLDNVMLRYAQHGDG